MKEAIFLGLLYCMAFLVGCGTAGHGLTDGYYKVKRTSSSPQKVYAVVSDSTIVLYPLLDGKGNAVDISQSSVIARTPTLEGDIPPPLTLVKTSIDLDLITVLFKYRFHTNTLPNQLNSNLNAALYAGYRTDFFLLRDAVNPLKRKEKRLRHYELDGGLFAGIGSASINSSVTNGQLDAEYDGFVFQKGVALFLGSGTFTLGVGAGADTLLDKNKSFWIYHEKWWLGLMVGINISG